MPARASIESAWMSMYAEMQTYHEKWPDDPIDDNAEGNLNPESSVLKRAM